MIAIAFILIIVVLYWYNTRTFNYWEKRGVKYDKPLFLVGNNLQNYLMQKSVIEIAAEMYWKYPKEKVVGFFRSTRPELLIRDPDIISRVLVTDFNYLHLRGYKQQPTLTEPLMRNIFFEDGDLWKLLRQHMMPGFTSSRVKAMFPLITERAERLQARARALAGGTRAVNAVDLMSRYTIDFIGACGFGLDVDSINDETSAFWKLGARIFEIRILDGLIIVLKELFPKACASLKYMGKVEKGVIELVNEIQRQRDYKPSGRNDLIDLMLEIKQRGKMVGRSIERVKPDGTPEQVEIELDENLFAAQVFMLLAAGFETSSIATSYTLHLLAYNPLKQKKVQDEIDNALSKHNNKICYDAVSEMTYLKWALQESMRIFNPAGIVLRECAKDYTIPEFGIALNKGVRILIPVEALQNDPRYWDKPEEFRPERFHPDEFSSIQKKIYLPFGVGPRMCIGYRLGMLESMAGLAAVLSQVTVSPASESVRRPKVDPKCTVVQRIKGGLPVLFTERKKFANI